MFTSNTVRPLLCVILLSIISPALAAEITVMPTLNGVTPIFLKGTIVPGDANDFDRVTSEKQKVLVVLSSPGGVVKEALSIGAKIRISGYATTVADECASACGLIWLSGVRRYLNADARVGFHAAYAMQNGIPTETGMTNADVGAFLAHLGLSREAIEFVTIAPPDGVRWLAAVDAQRLGINIQPSAPSNPGGSAPPEPPAYIQKPAREDGTKSHLVEVAFLGSELATALQCSRYYPVDEKALRAAHSELMKDGERYKDQFIRLLSSELIERSREMRRDGLARFCADQRELFGRSGLGSIYVNSNAMTDNLVVDDARILYNYSFRTLGSRHSCDFSTTIAKAPLLIKLTAEFITDDAKPKDQDISVTYIVEAFAARPDKNSQLASQQVKVAAGRIISDTFNSDLHASKAVDSVTALGASYVIPSEDSLSRFTSVLMRGIYSLAVEFEDRPTIIAKVRPTPENLDANGKWTKCNIAILKRRLPN